MKGAHTASASSPDKCDGESAPELPESLTRFLEFHGVDPAVYEYCGRLPRYIRLNPRFDEDATLSQLEAGLGIKPEAVPWIPGFYRLPSHATIARCTAYQQAAIYGIDAASGAAVVALAPIPGEHVLELCTAPGGKLCMIADTLGGRGSVTGVDLSEERVSACRNIVRKYKAQSCRLFRGDATSFCELPPQADDQVVREKGSQRQRARKRAKQQQQGEHTLVWSSCPQVWAKGGGETSRSEQGAAGQAISEGGQAHGAACQQLYDRVLVDAECTHDGSIKHIAKFREGGWGQFEAKFLSRLNDLEGLQRGLLRQGFRLVKPGGVLVYSTCSMTRAQNEDVVEWLLREEATATVVEIEQARGWPCRPGGIQHSVRLDPKTSETSALFICKLVKRVST